MALRFIDSFDHYQTTEMMAKWTTRSNAGFHTIMPGLGRCGTSCLEVTSGGSVELIKGVPFSGLTCVIGFAFMCTNQVFASSLFLEINSGVGSGVNLRIARINDGSLRVTRADFAQTILGTSAPDVTRINEWFYIEVRSVLDGAAGEVQIRVNGVEVLSLIGIDTVADSSAAVLTGFSFIASQSFVYRIDDLYALDASGPAPNNTFLGDSRVEYLRPTGDGVHQDWALIGAAAHWEAVDDGDSPDDDVSYIHTATVGQVDTEVYANTGLPAGTIFGLQIGLYARKTDSGFREVMPMIRHAGADYAGSSKAPSFASYVYLLEVFETNPGTGVAWTINDVNNAEYGVRLAV